MKLMDLIAVFRPSQRRAEVREVVNDVTLSRLKLEAAVADFERELTAQERTIKRLLDDQRKRRPRS